MDNSLYIVLEQYSDDVDSNNFQLSFNPYGKFARKKLSTCIKEYEVKHYNQDVYCISFCGDGVYLCKSFDKHCNRAVKFFDCIKKEYVEEERIYIENHGKSMYYDQIDDNVIITTINILQEDRSSECYKNALYGLLFGIYTKYFESYEDHN